MYLGEKSLISGVLKQDRENLFFSVDASVVQPSNEKHNTHQTQ